MDTGFDGDSKHLQGWAEQYSSEVNQHGPQFLKMWQHYINLPNTVFILLGNPQRQNDKIFIHQVMSTATLKAA